ncbi:MAG: ABC transporter permease [Desulfobacteraceae bacterium]|jgi:peptide/nickel transport system permease protein|nr:ABC transporter permease [Desulfobacteraceae bacterium]
MAAKPRKARLGWTFWLPLGWLAVVALAALTAELWPVPPPDRMDWQQLNAAPGAPADLTAGQDRQNGPPRLRTHWLGTDSLGRDLLARLIHGARVSLAVGLIAPLIGLFGGGLLGCLGGYYRGRIDGLITVLFDVMLAFPGLVLLLAVAFFLGPDLGHLIVALGFLSIPAFGRVARAQTLTLSRQAFVEAARLTGAGNLAILVREIVPNVAAPLAVYGLLVVAFMIMAEGALSFLGLGVPAPTPSWGAMIAQGREVLEEAPHVSLVPAAVMYLTVMSFNLIGDSLGSRFERRPGQL